MTPLEALIFCTSLAVGLVALATLLAIGTQTEDAILDWLCRFFRSNRP